MTGRLDHVRTWTGPVARRRARSVFALAAIVWGILTVEPRPPLGPAAGITAIALLTVCVVGWLMWVFQPERRPPSRADADMLGWPFVTDDSDPTGHTPVAVGGLVLTGVAGTALSFFLPHSAAVVFIAVAVVRTSHWWRPRSSAAFAAGLAAAYALGHLVIGDSVPWLLAGPAAIFTALLLGLVRRQNDALAADAVHARDERARFSALDERTRIAREIHDVLAHSLAALSVQLETADALLESGRVDQGHDFVRRAGQLAKEGMAETRRAIAALRGDTLPLPELLSTLAAGYRADLGAPASVEVTGQHRELRPDVALTLYRTAQEAITNVRKHAPKAAVDVRLDYRPDTVTLAVTSGAGSGDAPLSGTGSGVGLTGLRERAELAGGAFEAGPAGPGWRVRVRIPA